jgi:hypothetical protein
MLLLAVAHHHHLVAAQNDDAMTAAVALVYLIVGFVGLAVWVLIGLLIYRALVTNPIRGTEEHVEMLAAHFSDPADAALFRRTYAAKQPKSVLAAWLLTFFLSPTISYIYQNKWALAIIAFLTFQGLGIWWVISWFTMPGEVARYNQLLADKAFNEIMMVRPQSPRPYASAPPSALQP